MISKGSKLQGAIAHKNNANDIINIMTHRSHKDALMYDVYVHVYVTVRYLFHSQKSCFQWNSLLGKPAAVVEAVEGYTHIDTLCMYHYTQVNVYVL